MSGRLLLTRGPSAEELTTEEIAGSHLAGRARHGPHDRGARGLGRARGLDPAPSSIHVVRLSDRYGRDDQLGARRTIKPAGRARPRRREERCSPGWRLMQRTLMPSSRSPRLPRGRLRPLDPPTPCSADLPESPDRADLCRGPAEVGRSAEHRLPESLSSSAPAALAGTSPSGSPASRRGPRRTTVACSPRRGRAGRGRCASGRLQLPVRARRPKAAVSVARRSSPDARVASIRAASCWAASTAPSSSRTTTIATCVSGPCCPRRRQA